MQVWVGLLVSSYQGNSAAHVSSDLLVVLAVAVPGHTRSGPLALLFSFCNAMPALWAHMSSAAKRCLYPALKVKDQSTHLDGVKGHDDTIVQLG